MYFVAYCPRCNLRGGCPHHQGIEKGSTIALMCAESDPLDCHRFAMITPALVSEGFAVLHILKDKSVIANTELEDRLLKKYEKKLPRPDVFQTEYPVAKNSRSPSGSEIRK